MPPRLPRPVPARYNHKAVKSLDLVLDKMGGMDLGSALLRAQVPLKLCRAHSSSAYPPGHRPASWLLAAGLLIAYCWPTDCLLVAYCDCLPLRARPRQVLLKLCRARSSMNRHAEAMDDCQTAYSILSEPAPGVHVPPSRVREALEARAQAHEADTNYDDAVSDLRAAAELAGGGGDKARELEGALQRVQDLQRRWRCVDPSDAKAWHDNRCGNPRDPSSGRDHRRVLELPANLDELAPEKKCSWVSKQYRKLARVWHPDRYKGVKARAERKMRECAEAKEVLVRQLRCK